jgi:V/A-type H+-transporting ATPase subunit C
MILFRSVDFDYGNTRLRARRAALLRDADYQPLVGLDISGLLEALEATHYAPGAGQLGGQRGLYELHLLVRSHLSRSLEEMRSFYSGHARELVDALLSRFDVQNMIALLRARSHPDTTVEEAISALTPVGWLVEPLARQVLRPQELAGVVEAIAGQTPDREQAAVLRAAFSEYERTNDLPALERAVVSDHTARFIARVSSMGRAGATLLQVARREIDEHNLLVTLRLRDAIASGADGTPSPPDTLLPGGSIPPVALTTAVQSPAPAEVAAALGRLAAGRWQAPLERWATTGDLAALQRALERRAIADATALFVTGDPLTIDVPIAFMAAKQVEARNVRLLGEAAARGMTAELVRNELVWPGQRS